MHLGLARPELRRPRPRNPVLPGGFWVLLGFRVEDLGFDARYQVKSFTADLGKCFLGLAWAQCRKPWYVNAL